MTGRSYGPEFKLQVVLEALSSDCADGEIARANDIHPVMLSNWKRRLKESTTHVNVEPLPSTEEVKF